MLRDADIFVDRLYANAPQFGASLLVATHLALRGRSESCAGRRRREQRSAGHPTRGQCTTARSGLALDHRRPTDLGQAPHLRAAAGAPARSLLRSVSQRAAPDARGVARALRLRDRPGRPFDAVDGPLDAHAIPARARADIVPGTCGRTSADRRVIDLVDAHFRAAGLSVRHDDPYRGGFTTSHYGRPARTRTRDPDRAQPRALRRRTNLQDQRTRVPHAPTAPRSNSSKSSARSILMTGKRPSACRQSVRVPHRSRGSLRRSSAPRGLRAQSGHSAELVWLARVRAGRSAQHFA